MDVMIRKTIALFMLAFLCSCSVLELKPELVSIQPEVKHFVFIEKLPSGRTISDEKIYNKITEQIRKKSKIGALSTSHTTGQLYELSGLSVERDGNTINLSYINGDFHTSENVTHKTEIVAKYRVDIESKQGKKFVTLYTPSEINLRPGRDILYISINPLLSNAQVVSDIKKINMELSPIFKDTKKYTGEVNVQYNDESVYANFTRLLGKHKYGSDNVKKYDIEKGKLFSIGEKGKEFSVKISVFPYRNGSKVNYEFHAPYVVTNDCMTTFDDDKVQGYIAKIKGIAND